VDTKTEHSQSSGQRFTGDWYSVAGLRHVLKSDWWFLIAFTLSAIGLPLVYLRVPLHFDEGIYLTIGKQLAAGETLYLDFADHKPPGIFYLAAVIYELFSNPVTAARVLTYTVIGISGLLVFDFGRGFCRKRTAQAAGVLFILIMYLPHFDGFYFMTEHFAVLTLLIAAILLNRSSLYSDVAAGVSLGVGVLFNQTVFLFGATVIAFHLVKLWYPENQNRSHITESVKQILSIGIGFLGLNSIVFVALASYGLLESTIYYSIVLPFTNYSTPFSAWGHVLALGTLLPVWLVSGGMVIIVATAVFHRHTVGDRTLFVALWAGVMSFPGATGFAGDHKFLFIFPPLALLTTIGVAKLHRVVRETLSKDVSKVVADRSAMVTTLGAVVIILTVLVSGFGNAYYASNIAAEDIETEQEAFSNVTEGLDGPVYGYNVLAGMYVHTDTKPGTTYMGTIYSDRIARDKISDIKRNEIQYVVVSEHFVSNGKVTSSGYWTDHKSKMTTYLNEEYRPIEQRDNYVIFERTSEGQ
jgi:4-amino-4-deoxy-L-arabinose transferase-like glycosyltransferase